MLTNTDPGNPAELRAKRWGFGFYASHLGGQSQGGYYMKRWIIRLFFGFTIRFHLILRSDGDRHLHDHPFDFVSFLLTGGYVESVPDPRGLNGRRLIHWPRFSRVRKKAEDFHCLTLIKADNTFRGLSRSPEQPVLTLVFAGPKRREWGFATERGWCHNEEYDRRWPEHSASTRSEVHA